MKGHTIKAPMFLTVLGGSTVTGELDYECDLQWTNTRLQITSTPLLLPLQPDRYLLRVPIRAVAPVTGATATVTLLQLWLADPSLWFVQAENKFRSHRVTSEVRKSELLLEALPLQAMAEIHDILVQPRDEILYTTIKETLLCHLVPRVHRHIQQLLHNEELGDRRPTKFLRNLQHLIGDQL